MTIGVNVARLRLTYDGTTTPVPLTGGDGPLIFLSPSHLVASIVPGDGSAVIHLIYGTDYSITGDGTTGSASLVPTATHAAGVLVVRRSTPLLQDFEWDEGGGNPSARFESAEDYDRLVDQEAQERSARSLIAPDTDAPLDLTLPAAPARAGYLLLFDPATGAPRNSTMTEAELAALIAAIAYPPPVAATGRTVSIAASVAAGLTLQQASDLAKASDFDLSLDTICTVTADTNIDCKRLRVEGGKFIGTHNLTCNTAITAGADQIFALSGGAAVLGTIVAEAIPARWWWDGANDTAALQATLTYVNQSANRNAKLDWTGRASWSVTAQLVSDCGDQPQIIGSNGGIASSLSPDSTNLVASGLSAGTAILKVIGRAAPCGGSIQGFYFDSAPGAGLTAVEVDDAVGMLLRNSPSPNIARMNYLRNTSSEFTENTVIRDVVAGLGPTAVYLELAVTGGTNSFSGLDIDVDISLNSGDRTGVPVIKADTGSFPYNGRCSVFIHNNGANNAIIFSKPDATPPWWFAGGAIRLEGADAHPIIVNDLAGAPFYYGGTGPFCQGLTFSKAVVDISNIVYCDAFSYQPGGSVATKGARIYQQTIIFNGSLGVELAAPLNPNFAKVTGIVTASGYEAVFSTEFVVDQSGGVNGTKGNDLISLNTDTHSYGNPTIAMDSSKRIKLTNGSWPNVAANFSVVFQIRQMGD